MSNVRSFVFLSDDYATNKYITYGPEDNAKSTSEKERRAAELREQLLNMCADAMIATAGSDDVTVLINREIVYHSHGNGAALLAGTSKVDFYADLSQRIVQRAAMFNTADDDEGKIGLSKGREAIADSVSAVTKV